MPILQSSRSEFQVFSSEILSVKCLFNIYEVLFSVMRLDIHIGLLSSIMPLLLSRWRSLSICIYACLLLQFLCLVYPPWIRAGGRARSLGGRLVFII